MQDNLRDLLLESSELARLAASASLVGGFVHELRNENYNVAVKIHDLLANPSTKKSQSLRSGLQELAASVQRTDAILEKVRSLVSPTAANLPARADSVSAAREATDLLRAHRRKLRIRVRDRPLPDVAIAKAHLVQIYINLLLNSIRSGASSVDIKFDEYHKQGEEFVQIEIRDNGQGMDEATAAQAFDAFFSAWEDGTGLGLFIVKRLVLESGGTVSLVSMLARGTTVQIDLPIANEIELRLTQGSSGQASPAR